MFGVYMKYSSACEKTPAVFAKDVFFSMRELFCFAVALTAMVCNFLFCSFFQDFCSIHFLATCIKSLSIFLQANHNPLDDDCLRVLFCFLGFYLIQNWRL